MKDYRDMVLKDIKFNRGEVQENTGIEVWYDFEAYVVIKRDGKLYKVMLRQQLSTKKEEEEVTSFYDFMRSCIDHANRMYYMWIIPEKDLIDMYGKVVGALPFEFKEERMTKEEYEAGS